MCKEGLCEMGTFSGENKSTKVTDYMVERVIQLSSPVSIYYTKYAQSVSYEC